MLTNPIPLTPASVWTSTIWMPARVGAGLARGAVSLHGHVRDLHRCGSSPWHDARVYLQPAGTARPRSSRCARPSPASSPPASRSARRSPSSSTAHAVVDLWGGHADAARTRPWERDTIVNLYSVGKADHRHLRAPSRRGRRARSRCADRALLARVRPGGQGADPGALPVDASGRRCPPSLARLPAGRVDSTGTS